MRTKISFHRNENKYIKKFAWLKVASVDCELLLIAPFVFFISFFKGRVYTSLVSLINGMTFFEEINFKILNGYDRFQQTWYRHFHKFGKNSSLWQTLRRIVQWMTITINYIFWRQLSLCEIAPIWRLQKYVHFKYILWHFEYMS